jgi:hypothetical protein
LRVSCGCLASVLRVSCECLAGVLRVSCECLAGVCRKGRAPATLRFTSGVAMVQPQLFYFSHAGLQKYSLTDSTFHTWGCKGTATATLLFTHGAAKVQPQRLYFSQMGLQRYSLGDSAFHTWGCKSTASATLRCTRGAAKVQPQRLLLFTHVAAQVQSHRFYFPHMGQQRYSRSDSYFSHVGLQHAPLRFKHGATKVQPQQHPQDARKTLARHPQDTRKIISKALICTGFSSSKVMCMISAASS